MIISLLLHSITDFAVFLFGAFVCFAAGLLSFDSWKLNRHKKSPLLRGIGFFILAFVYGVYAMSTDISWVSTIIQILKIIGLGCIFISLTMEPVLHKPKVASVLLASSLVPVSFILTVLICCWYLRKATEGYEKQLRPIAIAFMFFSFSELVRIAFYWQDTSNVFWFNLLAVHGVFWNMYLCFLSIGFVIFGAWVWGYIRFRLQIQLFATLFAAILVVFFATTGLFSTLLVRNIEQDALSHLATDANVFRYAIDRLQLEALSHARAIAQDTTFQKAFALQQSDGLYNFTSQALLSHGLSSLVVASSSGEVVMRAEDTSTIGENIGSDPLVQSAISGQQVSTLLSVDNPVHTDMNIIAAVPIIYSDGKSHGVVLNSMNIDDAFVDGIKAVTGLDTTVFAHTTRTATTLKALDGISRFSGSLESNATISTTVLKEGNMFIGPTEVLQEPYYMAYVPLKKFGGEIIGMLSIGKPQKELLDTAISAIRLTFIGSVILMILAIGPVYLLSKYIEEHLEA